MNYESRSSTQPDRWFGNIEAGYCSLEVYHPSEISIL